MADLKAALERAREWDRTATPEQRKAMMDAQRESWIRGMAPCEHGDPDWETCPHCLGSFAEAEAIAKGLSPNAKRALMTLSGTWAPPSRETTRQAVASFASKNPHLCEREWQGGCASVMYYRLTPLGLAVQSLSHRMML